MAACTAACILLDHQKSVEFKQYLQDLCDDLSGLFLQEDAGRSIVVTGADVILPSALAIPLGFIVNEMITNSVKYATGNIAVGVETSATGHLLSVSDDGPGLSPAFDPLLSKGLGMKIIQTLVKQIGGTLQFGAGDRGRGARFNRGVRAASIAAVQTAAQHEECNGKNRHNRNRRKKSRPAADRISITRKQNAVPWPCSTFP